MQIYISRNGQPNGPYEIKDVNAFLATGTLLPTDLACQEGMTEWVPITQIPGVLTTGDSASAPVPSPNKKMNKILFGLAGIILLLGLSLFFFLSGNNLEKEVLGRWEG
ncbi:MAG: DUF4339 domain-containing protein [Limisphaerales bacterium]